MLNKFQRTYRTLHPIKLNVYKTSCDELNKQPLSVCCGADLIGGAQCECCGADGRSLDDELSTEEKEEIIDGKINLEISQGN